MTVEIRRVREAKFYIEADLEWLERKLNDQRATDFQKWVDELDFGVPGNLQKDIEEYQAEMKPYFDKLIQLREKLRNEIDAVQATIDRTEIETSEEVKRYLSVEEEEEEEKETR